MKFLELHERLRLETWRRIDKGILSSALLARQTGLARAHISNFLHRRRRLSLAALDRILIAQTLNVEDLSAAALVDVSPPHTWGREAADAVTIASQSTAILSPLIPRQSIQGMVFLPVGSLSGLPARRGVGRRSWDRFVAVRVTSAQALPMDPVLRVGSVVVLDRHYNSLVTLRPPSPNLYAIRAGTHLIFRHVSFESNRLVLRPRALEHPIEVIELAAQETPADLVVGRVCLCISEI
ncbi:MAG: helix-turn-helix domain-containing protein [Acidobacteriota bacterium]